MHNVKIRRPIPEDINELNHFFRTVITDTFIKEGIGDKLEDLEEEIQAKKTYLSSDLNSNGKERYFLLALDGDKIIGTIEYGAASDLICKCTDNAFKRFHEVGTVFVHPTYQRKGIGNVLLTRIMEILHSKEIKEFCLDSGYASAQKIWKKKFGDPAYLLKNYWGESYHHMIWRIKVRV
ncbi:GNAT family N-acetyltransferase [Sutcliffiella horikoshii]|uniref:GNAT family N-acetyltransferase n=1 Tax=Sutcliffiella horikoshii TaxID=79883 RepID=UPI001EEE045C|nr:GNAT family N-acetyltransferase [Sutcliffiella horikoshii]MCG1023594.1 GNAT family N-acetyltransferase [Sutcliffiella horikoshii]